jgi:drug/metabolite transporter (DMT)-like permease
MGYVLAGAFLISFASVFVKVADVGPTAAMFYRFLFGGLTLGCASIFFKESLWRGWRPMFWAVAAGVVFSSDLFFWHRSIHYVGPGLATILANFQVFGLAAVGTLFLKERLGWKRGVAIPLSMVGLFLLVGWDWYALGPRYHIGVVYGLITAAFYTFLTLTLRKSQTLPEKLSPMANMAWVGGIGAAIAGVEVHFTSESFTIPNVSSLTALLAYGILCSGLGWSLITTGLPRMDASQAGLILILQPTLAFVWDILLFSRETTIIALFGAVITLGAIYLGGSRVSNTGACDRLTDESFETEPNSRTDNSRGS